MKVHHLNCGCLCPARHKAWLSAVLPEMLVCHCLLIETQDRLILVDTGLGTEAIQNPQILGYSSLLLGIEKDTQYTATEQIKKLGFSPKDVTDLVLTHLDVDHAGGIPDFKEAKVHVSRTELEAAQAKSPMRLRERYRHTHIEGNVKWEKFDITQGERWNGFDCVKQLQGLPPEILLVSLPGHTPGHYGVAVQNDDRWIFHAGDSYFDRRDIAQNGAHPLWTSVYERIIHLDYPTAIRTKKSLEDLVIDPKIQMFCSHDPSEFNQFRV